MSRRRWQRLDIGEQDSSESEREREDGVYCRGHELGTAGVGAGTAGAADGAGAVGADAADLSPLG